MTEYEITYLTHPELDDEKRATVDQAIDENITQLGGTVTHSAPSVRRRLKYPVHQQIVAHARSIQTQLSPDKIEGLRTSLQKQENIIRTAIIKTPLRQEVPLSTFDKYLATHKESPAAKPQQKPATQVTMKEVEEKIEKALSEEVK